MLKRSDIKKMRVWQNGHGKHECYVLCKNSDGSCIAVSRFYEHSFENGLPFETICFQNCETIPEPKKRIMTRNEVLKFVLENHDKILVSFDSGNRRWHIGGCMSFGDEIKSYSYIFIDELGNDEQPKKFEIEVSDE